MKTIYNLYKQRLIEISGRNRSLFSKKINNKFSYDIGKVLDGDYDAIDDFVDFLWKGKRKSYTLIGKENSARIAKNFDVEKRIEKKFENNNELSAEDKKLENQKREKLKKEESKKISLSQITSLKTLKREIEEFSKETGRYELYVGYPFVEGAIGRDLIIKAPLILFPITINIPDEETVEIELKSDEQIQFNKVLLLAYANQMKLEIENLETDYECLPAHGFKNIDDVLKYLATFGIKFSHPERKGMFNFERSREPRPGDSLVVKHYAVLGRFPLANSIYNDYCTLEKERLSTEAINELLENKKAKKIKKPLQDLFTVNNLDYAQESTISKLNSSGNMVIYGPPGTGKSQTIVNIITDAICKGKKVLVVSQKKAALDVVYNRLGILNSKAMFITDANKRKFDFYNKAKVSHENMMATRQLPYVKQFEDIENKIAKEVSELEIISKVLFEKTNFGLSLQEMYANSQMIGKNSADYVIYKNLIKNNEILKLNYYDLRETIRVIKEKKKAELYYKFVERKRTNPLIDYIKNDIDVHTLNQAKNLISKVTNSRVVPFDMGRQSHTRELLSFYLENNVKSNVNYKPLTKFVAVCENPKLYDKLKLSKILFPCYPYYKYKTLKYENQIEENFQKTIHVIEDFISEYSILEHVLTPKGYSMTLDNILSGNTLQLKLLGNALDDYVEVRDINISLGDLTDTEKLILKFAYKNSKNMKIFLYVVDKLLNMRVYHEAVTREAEHKNELAKLLDFENIRNRILSLKAEQKEVSKCICIEKFNDEYVEYFNRDQESKNFLYQITKQQNLWPIRKTMEVYKNYLFKLFPCWILSPESVSDILPLEKELFDIVLFDEASQVFIESTLPTIFRGKHIVVAGDGKQLRPTATFVKRYMGNDSMDELDYSTQAALEVESLLDLAMSRYNSANLTYHYRSKNEELINFSNYAFYEGKLQIAPNITKNVGKKPIERIKVNGRWIDRKNIVEAKEVAKLLQKISKSRTNKQTIGIIAFNTEQETAIEDAIDELCAKDEQFKTFILKETARKENGEDVSLFVKNLENVQGDERDIIIFSIGYAKNEYDKVAYHFGSLSIEGGENRLNVAVTRAKEKIYVITSIEPEELNVDNSKNAGPKYLKSYLKYVRAVSNENKMESQIILENLNIKPIRKQNLLCGNLEEEIASELKKAGYIVETNIGNTDYRISVAVYDKKLDKYILGIECDYTAYISSDSILERDVYHPNFLNSRGWKIVRVWSRDWWQSKQKIINNLIKEIEKIKQKFENEKAKLEQIKLEQKQKKEENKQEKLKNTK